ncbi:unnamed protein product, partial [Prorocentrum cordatum]
PRRSLPWRSPRGEAARLWTRRPPTPAAPPRPARPAPSRWWWSCWRIRPPPTRRWRRKTQGPLTAQQIHQWARQPTRRPTTPRRPRTPTRPPGRRRRPRPRSAPLPTAQRSPRRPRR